MNDHELCVILNTMDIPENRKDITNKANIQWLLRNISIRNFGHAKLNNVIEELKGRMK